MVSWGLPTWPRSWHVVGCDTSDQNERRVGARPARKHRTPLAHPSHCPTPTPHSFQGSVLDDHARAIHARAIQPPTHKVQKVAMMKAYALVALCLIGAAQLATAQTPAASWCCADEAEKTACEIVAAAAASDVTITCTIKADCEAALEAKTVDVMSNVDGAGIFDMYRAFGAAQAHLGWARGRCPAP